MIRRGGGGGGKAICEGGHKVLMAPTTPRSVPGLLAWLVTRHFVCCGLLQVEAAVV